jgi:D-alanyl-lipoteichoic acid acyltransferase DltB (MBOAT superfamily)
MLFNSLSFFLFFPVACAGYFLLPFRVRWMWLLAASYLFYAWWRVDYLALIVASTLVDYAAGLAMGRAQSKRTRLLCLLGSLTCNLGLLITFKYYGFFRHALLRVFGVHLDLPELDLLLPVGISFYTFQTLSYSIEVFRGTHPPERHLGRFALYVAFFPQLVAGPIERSGSLLPQLREQHLFDYDRVVAGLRLMLWGLFKKVVVADRLALMVDTAYGHSDGLPGPLLILATVCFAFQIYCDFSGYSDIAVGAARVMGYRLRINFIRPYAARSMGDFWRRWHISLSTWFRDYVYLPLGGGHVRMPRLWFNVLAVFTLSGLWHGANWTFLAWGLYHGILFAVGRTTRPVREALAAWMGAKSMPRTRAFAQWALTFTLVLVGWVFFRAESIGQAVAILTGWFSGWIGFLQAGPLTNVVHALETSAPALGINAAALALVLFLERNQPVGEAPLALSSRYAVVRWPLYVLLFIAMMGLGTSREIPFIYFQF